MHATTLALFRQNQWPADSVMNDETHKLTEDDDPCDAGENSVHTDTVDEKKL